MKKFLAKNSFVLSLLLHLLLLLCLLFYVHLQPNEHKPQAKYVPSYAYTGAVLPAAPSHAVSTERAGVTTRSPLRQQQVTSPQEIAIQKKGRVGLREILNSSFEYLENSQRQTVQSMASDVEPIYMIGDMNNVADPLIMLLGKAISKHFQYPEMAGKMGISGRALVRITLLPEGNIVNVTMVKSTNSHELDTAALYAINKAPIIAEASDYIKEPKTMVIGFIFRVGGMF